MADSKLARTERNMVIVEKLKKLEDDQTGLVAVINEIFKILWHDGLVYKLKVEPEKVGPHKTNRGGTGVCGAGEGATRALHVWVEFEDGLRQEEVHA